MACSFLQWGRLDHVNGLQRICAEDTKLPSLLYVTSASKTQTFLAGAQGVGAVPGLGPRRAPAGQRWHGRQHLALAAGIRQTPRHLQRLALHCLLLAFA